MKALARFDAWCRRCPVLSWGFVIALAGDIAFVAVLVGGCTASTQHEKAIAECQRTDAGNPVHVADCWSIAP